jgi:drug/metabolite transporter (DMT)-like permease
VLVAWSQYLNSLALKLAPISLCVPFTAFAPIFVLGTGYLVLGELPTVVGMMGIGLIVVGGVLMHRRLFAVGFWAPFQAIVREPGSRFMVLSVLLGAIFSPLEKQLILMSDSLTAVFYYGAGTMIALGILGLALRVNFSKVMKEKPKWAVLSGVMDALMTLAQFIAVMYLPVVITMCIKRAGIVLTVLAGWLIFRERDITDRLIGALAMVGGIALFYLPLRPPMALALTAAVVTGLAISLYLTRNSAYRRALEKHAV